jgi:hypothetical protein
LVSHKPSSRFFKSFHSHQHSNASSAEDVTFLKNTASWVNTSSDLDQFFLSDPTRYVPPHNTSSGRKKIQVPKRMSYVEDQTLYATQSRKKKLKGEVHRTTGHEGPEGE